eukprot:m.243163 g.243163  ORF g.243163 m.243163 type:complete len:738 (-) comp14187_c0_seq1:217-2430(-)
MTGRAGIGVPRRWIFALAGALFMGALFMFTSFLPGTSSEPAAGVRRNPAAVKDRHLQGIEQPVRPHKETNSFGLDSEWFPISVVAPGSDNPQITFCQINFTAYHANPSRYPMSRDLVALSCPSSNRKTIPITRIKDVPGTLKPTGFVFHTARCGSTTVANVLASDPENAVFSESQPVPDILQRCEGCSDEKKVHLLRVVMAAFGNTAVHRRLFFKFQSAMTPYLHLIRQAFPTVPWIFVFRNPTEIMVSLLSGSRSSPCLRSRSNPPPHIAMLLDGQPGKASDPAYCAAHLHYLYTLAFEEATSGGGVLVDYEGLVDTLLGKVFPGHFNYAPSPEAVGAMRRIASVYSKSRQDVPPEYASDSNLKQQKATEEMRLWAQKLVEPLYGQMKELGAVQVQRKSATAKPAAAAAQPLEPGPTVFPLEPKLEELNEANIHEYLPFPQLRPMRELIDQWSPDDVTIPDIPGIFEGSLEHFDYQNVTQRSRAGLLRYHEVPFVISNVPEIDAVVAKWTDDYLTGAFGPSTQKIHQSIDNHFPYFNRHLAARHPEYKPHTRIVDMSYKDWLKRAEAVGGPDTEHFYFQTSDFTHRWISKDIPIFTPKHNFFVVDPRHNRGINCRFGARGTIAQAHWDGGRNFVACLKGKRRYIILPPSACDQVYLYPRDHPEGRHSEKDWSKPDWNDAPLLAQAPAAQVILRPGDVLYLPSYWFHYIVTLETSAQCNTRSGDAVRGAADIRKCGF